MFDLSFRIFRTRVRVSIWFWAFAVLFGWMMGVLDLGGWQLMLLWVACEFVASIAKVIGHVLAGQYFGYPGTVVLGGMNSKASGDYDQAPRWQRIVINAAGPIAGLWFYYVVYIVTPPLFSWAGQRGVAVQEYTMWTLMFLCFLTLFWNMFNLLPMLPTNGGVVLQNVLGYAVGRRDFVVATVVSILVALSFIGYSLYARANPETPFLREFVRQLYPFILRENRFASFKPDAGFFALIFGYYAVINLIALFRKPKGQESATRVA